MPTSSEEHDKAKMWTSMETEKGGKWNRFSRFNCCGGFYSAVPITLSLIALFLVIGTIFGVGVRWHQMTEELNLLKKEVNMSHTSNTAMASKQKATTDKPATGVVYTRWGKKTCPEDNELVYSGFGAGSSSENSRGGGGGAEYICMPPNPEYNKFDTSNDSLAYSWIYGAEYLSQVGYGIFNDEVHGHNVACSVCLSPRTSKVMVPGWVSCSMGWTQEYTGYLMSSYVTANKMSFECVDENPDVIAGTANITGGAQLYFVSAYCGPSGVNHCPPYVDAQELACVMCTK